MAHSLTEAMNLRMAITRTRASFKRLLCNGCFRKKVGAGHDDECLIFSLMVT